MSTVTSEANAELITGQVHRTVFYRDGFAIVMLRVGKDYVTVKGLCTEPSPGAILNCQGGWKKHPNYGDYFAATSIREQLPTDAAAVQRYLVGAKIPGIGKVTAKKLTDAFGEQIFDVLSNYPERLRTRVSIPVKTMNKIGAGWQRARLTHEVDLFLSSIGIAPGRAAKVVRLLGDNTPGCQQIIARIKRNPYELVLVPGIAFLSADAAALRLGIERNSHFRLAAGLVYTLQEMAREGHTLAYKAKLISRAAELLGADETLVAMELDAQLFAKNTEIVATAYNGEPCIALHALHSAELGIAQEIKRLLDSPTTTFAPHDLTLDDHIKRDDGSGIELAPIQQQAVKMALTKKASILTGGPGMGKTSISRRIVTVAENAQRAVLLCAPTGRAAKRLAQTTGREAYTIHRLLGYRKGVFEHNRNNPLPCDLLIVDETSMADVALMYALLRALPETASVLFVGDADQLPAVSAGKVLADLIRSGCIPTVELTKIYRQGEGSGIIVACDAIRRGAKPTYCPEFKLLRRFIEDPQTGERQVREMKDDSEGLTWLLTYLRRQFAAGLDPKDLQVIAPMRKGTLGVDSLNMALQELINPPSPGKPQIAKGGRIYRVGDRVIQVHNNYDLTPAIMNGDIGYIVSIDADDGTLIVDFDGAVVELSTGDLDDLRHATAITIHRALGGQFPTTAVVCTTTHAIMLNRQLLYTAVSRAQNDVVLIGTTKAIAMAVRNTMHKERLTTLDQYLRRFLTPLSAAAA